MAQKVKYKEKRKKDRESEQSQKLKQIKQRDIIKKPQLIID